jgi:hypothetical protein
MTAADFFEAYQNGQRNFHDLDFENLDGFSGKDFSDVLFENCYLHIDFRQTNLTNASFINCNIKEIDLRKTNLTNALIKNCLVESALFKGATITGCKFVDNYYFGITLGQTDFEKEIAHTDAYILKTAFTEEAFKNTMVSGLTNIAETVRVPVNIWAYVKDLAYEGVVIAHVYQNKLVETAYRTKDDHFDHILLPTDNKQTYIVIVVSLEKPAIYGYYRLDLNKEYGLVE